MARPSVDYAYAYMPNTNSPEVLAKIELSRQYQVPVTMHVAEMAGLKKPIKKHNCFLRRTGLFERAVYFSALYLATDEDLASLAATNGNACRSLYRCEY